MISFSLLALLALSPCDDALRLADEVGRGELAVESAASQLDPSLSELAVLAESPPKKDDAAAWFVRVAHGQCISHTKSEGYSDAVKSLLEENNITSVREWDPLQRLAYIIGNWLDSFFDDAGVQKYATQISRVFFVVAFVVVVLLLAYQLWRRRERKVQAVKERHRQEKKRLLKFSEWRQKADAALAQGHVRASLNLGQMALLIRLGELAPNVVDDTRTHDEIIAALPKNLEALAPLLREVRDVFFAGRETPEYARAFLAKVDTFALAKAGEHFSSSTRTDEKAAS